MSVLAGVLTTIGVFCGITVLGGVTGGLIGAFT